MEERDLLERFKGYDMDGDGKISVQDLKDNFLKYGDQLDQEMIKRYMQWD